MVLVTGATGFLGSELVLQLIKKGEKVRALKRLTSRIPALLQAHSAVEWFDADLLDQFSLLDALEGVEKVYHCGAMISFNRKDRARMLKVNVGGTSNLLNACMEKGIRKLLHVSSIAAIGDARPGQLSTEKDHWEFGAGHSGYSVSKYESEMEVFRAHAEGLSAVIVNPSIIIGKNAGNAGSGKLFETVKKGMPYYPAGGCGYVDVEDVASIMITLMDSDISGERFILNAENRSHRDLFNEIAGNFGKKPASIALKPWMLQVARIGSVIQSVFTGKPATLSADTVKSAFKTQFYSNEKIKNTIGFEFRPLSESIATICRNFNTA